MIYPLFFVFVYLTEPEVISLEELRAPAVPARATMDPSRFHRGRAAWSLPPIQEVPVDYLDMSGSGSDTDSTRAVADEPYFTI